LQKKIINSAAGGQEAPQRKTEGRNVFQNGINQISKTARGVGSEKPGQGSPSDEKVPVET